MSTNPVKKSFQVSIAVKLCAMIIVICMAATIIVSLINYHKYLDAVYDVHNKYIYEISQLIESCLTEEQWAEYSELLSKYREGTIDDEKVSETENSDAFISAYARIQQIVDSHELESVSIFLLDREKMNHFTEADFDLEESDVLSFLMDFYTSDSDLETYETGNQDYMWGTYADFTDYRDIFNEMYEDREDACISEYLEDGGMYLTDYHPVLVHGEVAAYIMVCGNAIEIEDFMHSFFIQTLLIGLAITAVLVMLAMLLIWFCMIRPLKLLKKESQEFVRRNAGSDDGNEHDIVISDKLAKIKTHDEIQDLAVCFLQMENDIKDYVNRVTTVTAEKERISTELNVATKIQEDMLPRIFPAFPDRPEFDIYASMDPAKEVGGDFYDFFLIDDTHLGIVIADVAGKGVPAALFMVIAKTLIKNRTLMGGSPSEILEYVNNQLCENNESNMFVTVWMAIIDLETGKGIASNAGHEHPIRKDKDCNYELVRYRHSLAVASLEDIPFRQHTFALKPGDRLFVYTDGLPEATNSNNELYGTDRIMQVLNENKSLPVSELLPVITESVEQFVGEAPQFDDLTMLVFEYHGTD